MKTGKIIKNALMQPVVMFLFGMITTLILLSAITPTLAETNNIIPDNNFVNTVATLNTERPMQNSDKRDIASPQNFFETSQIKVYRDRVILEADNIVWAAFEDTKSMLPVINKDANALQIVPNCPDEIAIGDIISYRSHYATGIIIHRVVHIDKDEQGIYFVLKGDNNPASDPGKIRCDQIDRKVIAIIY